MTQTKPLTREIDTRRPVRPSFEQYRRSVTGRLSRFGFFAFNLALSAGIFLVAPILLAPLVVLFLVACSKLGRLDSDEMYPRRTAVKAPSNENLENEKVHTPWEGAAPKAVAETTAALGDAAEFYRWN